jgi:hypothetical protein
MHRFGYVTKPLVADIIKRAGINAAYYDDHTIIDNDGEVYEVIISENDAFSSKQLCLCKFACQSPDNYKTKMNFIIISPTNKECVSGYSIGEENV